MELFPAPAGVILPNAPGPNISVSFPRTRGGDPIGISIPFGGILFSPHPRG